MSSKSRSATLGFVPIILIVVVLGAYLGLSVTPASTSLSSSHIVPNSSRVSSPTTSLCTLNGTGKIGLTVVDSSSNKGVPGLSVLVNETAGVCTPASNPWELITDPNGTIMTQGVGSFNFTLKYNGLEYRATGELGPMELACLTLYVPSGQVTARSTSLSNSAYYCSNAVFVGTTTSHTNSTR